MTLALLFLFIAVILVVIAGFLVAVDAAFAVTSRMDIEQLAANGRNSGALRKIAADLDAHVHSVALARVVTEGLSALLITAASVGLWGQHVWTYLIAAAVIVVLAVLQLAFNPRARGRAKPESVLRFAAGMVRSARVMLGPLVHIVIRGGKRVSPGSGRSAFTSEEQLLSMVDEAASHDLIEADDRDLIHSVFDFTDRYVRSVMVPRTDMLTVPADTTTEEAMALFLQRGVSRMPVTGDDTDDIVGVLYLKDLVQFAYRDESRWRSLPVRPMARAALFVPESLRAEALLQQMRKDAVHVRLVVDEYGGISGLVTLEDLIEELVGDIVDEYDGPTADDVQDLGDGRFQVTARVPLDEVGDLFSLEINDEDVDTIGGLLTKALGELPKPGSRATAQGIIMTGGASAGRRRGLATVFVEREAPATSQTASEGASDE